MKKLTRYTLSLIAFWFLVFLINRIFFICYQMPLQHKIHNRNDVYHALYKGFALDLSVAAMLSLPLILLGVLYFVTEKKVLKSLTLIMLSILLVLYIGVCLADAGLYREWNAKINMQALQHFKNPAEVFKTLGNTLLLSFVVLLSVLFLPFYFLYRRKVHPTLQGFTEGSNLKRIGTALLFFVIGNTLGIIAIRGGVGDITINQSAACFSNETFANDIAVNPLYTLIQDIDIKSKLPDTSLYKIGSNRQAVDAIRADYAVEKDTTLTVLNTLRPNIIFIFLESWSADNIGALGGVSGCTPCFDSISKESLLFTQAYSHAYVSDQGIVTGLSAFPSAHRLAIVNQPGKIAQLPCISEDLLSVGYHTAFLYGGDLLFGNLRAYILEKKFEKVIESKDLPQYPHGKLGVHDEYTFQELLHQVKPIQRPFFMGYFTLSSHLPYDHPRNDDWQSANDDAEKAYTESMHYADKQLGNFFAQARRLSWYDSTLIVMVADHSHNSIKQWDAKSAMRHRIPIMFAGGALEKDWRGKTWNKIVSQLDIVSTLLHQLKLNSSRYPWSRNMLNPTTPSSAYYTFYGGGGYVNEKGFVADDYNNPTLVCTNISDSALLAPYKTKALRFQQLVFENVRLRK